MFCEQDAGHNRSCPIDQEQTDFSIHFTIIDGRYTSSFIAFTASKEEQGNFRPPPFVKKKNDFEEGTKMIALNSHVGKTKLITTHRHKFLSQDGRGIMGGSSLSSSKLPRRFTFLFCLSALCDNANLMMATGLTTNTYTAFSSSPVYNKRSIITNTRATAEADFCNDNISSQRNTKMSTITRRTFTATTLYASKSSSSLTTSRQNLEKLKVPELKEKLRTLGLKVGGRKSELIERLLETTTSKGTLTNTELLLDNEEISLPPSNGGDKRIDVVPADGVVILACKS